MTSSTATATATVDAATLLRRFQAVSEETRFEIVRRLSAGERCVCDLQADLDAAQSRLSFHLKKLKEAGVVTDRREGRWAYYSLVPAALEEMRVFLGEVNSNAHWVRRGSAAGTSVQGGACCRAADGC